MLQNTNPTSDNDLPLTSPSSGVSGLESSSPADNMDIRTYLLTTMQGSQFTDEEVKKFERRLKENYNPPDKRYDEWLLQFHPNAERLAKSSKVVVNQIEDQTDTGDKTDVMVDLTDTVDPQKSTEASATCSSKNMHPF